MASVLQITLPSYIQAPTTAVPPPAAAVPPPATAVPPVIISAQQTAEELPAAANHHPSPCLHPGSQPHDLNVDEGSATKHALLPSHKRPSEIEDVPGARPESASVISAGESRGAVEAGPDQHPALYRRTEHQNHLLGADHEQHASPSHGHEAMRSALDSEPATGVNSLALSKTIEDRSSPDQCLIVDAQDMDLTELHELDQHTHQDCHQKCEAKAYKHDLQDTTAAAAIPPMTTDIEHVSTTAVADQKVAITHADEMDAGSGRCSSQGLQAGQHSSAAAAQVTLLVGKSQQNLASRLDLFNAQHHRLLQGLLKWSGLLLLRPPGMLRWSNKNVLGNLQLQVSATCIEQIGPQQPEGLSLKSLQLYAEPAQRQHMLLDAVSHMHTTSVIYQEVYVCRLPALTGLIRLQKASASL